MTVITLSPAEVLLDVLTRLTRRDVVQHIVVGPLSEKQQQEGGVSIMDAGEGAEERYLPLTRPRMQLRCIGPDLIRSEEIGRHVGWTINEFPGRTIGHQISTNEDYLVHTVEGSGGPSAHRDTEGTWEYLLFVEALIGTTPIS